MDEGGIVTTPRTPAPARELPAVLPVFLWAGPGLTLAVAGFFHPDHLTHARSHTWWGLHVDHIFWPVGALGIALVGVGTGWLASIRHVPVKEF